MWLSYFLWEKESFLNLSFVLLGPVGNETWCAQLLFLCFVCLFLHLPSLYLKHAVFIVSRLILMQWVLRGFCWNSSVVVCVLCSARHDVHNVARFIHCAFDLSQTDLFPMTAAADCTLSHSLSVSLPLIQWRESKLHLHFGSSPLTCWHVGEWTRCLPEIPCGVMSIGGQIWSPILCFIFLCWAFTAQFDQICYLTAIVVLSVSGGSSDDSSNILHFRFLMFSQSRSPLTIWLISFHVFYFPAPVQVWDVGVNSKSDGRGLWLSISPKAQDFSGNKIKGGGKKSAVCIMITNLPKGLLWEIQSQREHRDRLTLIMFHSLKCCKSQTWLHIYEAKMHLLLILGKQLEFWNVV